MTTEQSALVAPGVSRDVLVLQWIVVGLLALLGGITTRVLIETPSTDQASLSYWVGGALGQTAMIALIPAIVAVCTRFRRPWLVLLVWAPIAAFFMLGAVGMREIRAGNLRSSAQATQAAPAPSSTSNPKWNDIVSVTTPTAQAVKGDNAPRCQRLATDGATCAEWLSPPAGYYWDSPAKPAVTPEK